MRTACISIIPERYSRYDPVDTSSSLTNTGSEFERSKNDLWKNIMNFSCKDIHTVILDLRRSFDDNRTLFDEFIKSHFSMGISGDTDSKGYLVGDRILALSQEIRSYNNSMEAVSRLIRIASEIGAQVLEGLTSLIGETSFATELSGLIYKLGFPERAYSTLLLAARCAGISEPINFHIELQSSARRLPFALIPASQQVLVQTQKPEKSNHAQDSYQTSTDSTSYPTPATSRSHSPTTDSVQPLDPDVAQLVETVMQDKLLPVHTNAWYVFGFACTGNEETERRLAGLYKALITEAPISMTHDLQRALHANSLVALFDKNAYSHFRTLAPYLEVFLNTPPPKRPTVWRLIQFIHDTHNTEPPACLRRDYGFRFCRQREEVLYLKEIHSALLDKLGPKPLHDACVYGRLRVTALREGVVLPRERGARLLENDFPSPALGFDSEDGLAAYQMPLFKKKMKE